MVVDKHDIDSTTTYYLLLSTKLVVVHGVTLEWVPPLQVPTILIHITLIFKQCMSS